MNQPMVDDGKAVGQFLNALPLALHLLKGFLIDSFYVNLSLLGGRGHFFLVLLENIACFIRVTSTMR